MLTFKGGNQQETQKQLLIASKFYLSLFLCMFQSLWRESYAFWFRTQLLLVFVAGETLELAVYLSVKLKDQQAFARHVSQLRTYYTDVRYAMCASGGCLSRDYALGQPFGMCWFVELCTSCNWMQCQRSSLSCACRCFSGSSACVPRVLWTHKILVSSHPSVLASKIAHVERVISVLNQDLLFAFLL